MKKIIATIICVLMLICCFSLPCIAADTSSGIHLVVEYKADTGMLKLSGRMATTMGRNWATFYMLNPGKTRDEIPQHSDSNEVFSYYEEIDAAADGSFEYEFKHTGAPDVYTLYFTTGYAHLTREIDTRNDVLSEPGRLEALKGLPTSYGAPTASTVEDLFAERREELPSEMPVVQPAEIKGLTEVFVDVNNGDDATATGAIDKPYKTIKQALKEHPARSGMVLYLREGTYLMSEGMFIADVEGTEELPFIVSNYNNEKVTVSGGETIKVADFESVTDQDVYQRFAPEAADKILVVDLKEKYGMTNFGEISKDSQPALFVGESKYTIARWPNSETTEMKEYKGADADKNSKGVSNGVIDSGAIDIAVGSECGPARTYSKWYTELLASGKTPTAEETAMAKGVEFCIEDLRPFSWVNTGDIWAYGRFYDEWTLDHLNIVKFNPEKGSIRTKEGISWGCKYTKTDTYSTSFYYYNVLEELDSPGEWFVDKNTGKLYVYPTADFKEDTEILYAISNAKYMLDFTRCKNVVLNGIKFEKAKGEALRIVGYNESDSVVVQNCSFENLGSGVYVVGKYSGVINSTFKDIEDYGVYLEGDDREEKKQLIPDRQFVQNCVFYNTKGVTAAGIGQIISHNFVSNNVGSCLSISGNETVVEYNEIVAGPRVTTDSGAIYVNGNDMFKRGNHVRYNYIHSTSKEPRAVYFDDMLSECYIYGNIIDGSWIQLHTGSENTIYNNVLLNYTNTEGENEGPIRITNQYWQQQNSGETRWKTGALEYGSITKKLLASEGYGGNGTTITGAYADRYPLLKKWAELMYRRITEYENNGKTVANAKTSSIISYTGSHTHTYYYSSTSTYATTQKINLNAYLASARDNYVANNVMINTGENRIDIAKHASGRNAGKYSAKFSGYIRTVDENNTYFTTAQNPFASKGYADASVYESLGIEPIPYSKMGLLSEEDYAENAKVKAISPVEVSISAKDLSLKWASVEGAQEYFVEVATDKSFSPESMVESDTTYDLSYQVKASLESDKVYYWRVSTTATHKYATGEVEISDAFKFTTLIEGQERNQVGVTVYSVDVSKENDNFNVTTYAYKLTDSAKNATIHIACYSEDNRLISTKSKTITVPANGFTSEYVFNFTAPNTKKIKLFVWDANGKMIPYTYVKTL